MIEISVVIPVYKGIDFIEDLIKRISEVRNSFDQHCGNILLSECVCVCDDTQDGSYEKLLDLQTIYPWLQTITLSKNCGQHAATAAGITYTSGDWVITLDEDLQHDPHYIPHLILQSAEQSSDIVYAKPSKEGPHSAFRNTSSKLAKRLIAYMSGIDASPHFNSFRAIRGSIARSAASSITQDTYFDIALSWYTSRVTYLSLQMRDERTASGRASSYTIKTLISHATRLAVSSDIKLMHFGTTSGFLGFASGTTALILLVSAKLMAPDWASDARGWASTVATLLLFNGLIMLQCGIALKFLTKMVQRSQGRPGFFVIDRRSDSSLVEHLRGTLQNIERSLKDASKHPNNS